MLETRKTGDARTAFRRSGAGPLLLLMHGAEGSHRMFDAITPQLARDFTVLAYDQRDCGDTQGPDAAATVQQLADDAKALLEALGHERAHVYGTSFGGRVAQALAIRHPRCVQRLVLGSTWPLPERLEALNAEGVARIGVLRSGLPETAEALAELFFTPAFLEAQPQWKSFLRSAQPASARSQRRFAAVADCPQLPPQCIQAPTLLLAGALDRVVPPAVTLGMAQAIPNCEAVRLPGVGHAASIQAPETIAAHIRRFCLASPNQES